MLDNLVTPVVAIAIILGITLPIWLLVMLARLVHHARRIADALEDKNSAAESTNPPAWWTGKRKVSNSMFAR